MVSFRVGLIWEDILAKFFEMVFDKVTVCDEEITGQPHLQQSSAERSGAAPPCHIVRSKPDETGAMSSRMSDRDDL